MSDYATKLRDGRWQKKRLEIFDRDGWQCYICGSGNDLQVHHNWYIGRMEPWDYDESQLITLCGKHHEWASQVHQKLKEELSVMTPQEQNALLLKIQSLKSETCKSVKLTAHRQTEEPFRLVRLRQVIEFLIERDDTALLTLIALHDHKGCLEASLAPFTPESSFRALEDAWRLAGECDCKHFGMEVMNDVN